MAMVHDVRALIPEGQSERGFILIAVLVLVAFLISVLACVLQTTSSYLFSTAAYVEAAREDELGRTAANLVVQKILSSDPGARSGGSFSVELPDAKILIDYVAESARADVNATQPDLLVALFKAAGIEPETADAIGGRIRAWSDSVNSSSDNDDHDSSDTNKNDSKAKEKRLRLEHIAEIESAWGVSDDELAKVAPYLTVSNAKGKIDPILADPLLVNAMFGNPTDASAFLKHRTDGFKSESDALMAIPLGARGYVGFSPAIAFHATVHVELRNRIARHYEMTVIPPQKDGEGVRVSSWNPL